MASKTTVTDEIYRAAIETAGHLGSPVEVSAAVRALAYELELRGLTVVPSLAGDSDTTARILVVDSSNGICVGADTERAAERDFGHLLRSQSWQYVHEIVFGTGRLQIKSVAA